MTDEQKMIGAGSSQGLDAAATYDAQHASATSDKDGPQIFQLNIISEGTITTLESYDGTDLLPNLGGLEDDAAIVGHAFTFKEGQYAAKIVTGTAKVIIHKTLQ
jgi:hypothetical protein